MAAYLIAQIEITDPEGFEAYRQEVAPTLAAYGGTYVVRGGRMEVLEGEPPLPRMVVVRFPSYDQAKRWWESDDYAGPKALRHRSARTNAVLVEGVEP
jgi:uncharacterized protein (DUF1330 family)